MLPLVTVLTLGKVTEIAERIFSVFSFVSLIPTVLALCREADERHKQKLFTHRMIGKKPLNYNRSLCLFVKI